MRGRWWWQSTIAVCVLIAVSSAPVLASTAERGNKRHTEVGRASWYGARGNGLHGQLTASGERFDALNLTAAHRSHPFGTRLRVTNLANGLSVVVRVNDRGPRLRGRVIDVSRAAAASLGFQRRGTARVRVERLR